MRQGEGMESSKACPLTPSPKIELSTNTAPRKIIIAASLTFILVTASLAYYVMQAPPPWDGPSTANGAIEIDGDANFAAGALLEGWPGDGSPENPYIIDGLEINLGGEFGPCIDIRNTRVSFTIRSCKLTGAGGSFGWIGGDGIYLENVMNGELVANTVDGIPQGILLRNSTSNSLVNNTCNNNGIGISLEDSHSNTVADNTCKDNDIGISFEDSHSNIIANNTLNGCGFFISGTLAQCRQLEFTRNSVNTLPLVFLQDQVGDVVSSPAGQVILVGCSQVTVKDQALMDCSVGVLLCHTNLTTLVNNTCTNNGVGIELYDSHYNTVANNTFSSNGESGICLSFSNSNSLVNNTISSSGPNGIALDSSNNNTITGNTALYNSLNGILVVNGNGNTIAANLLNDNGQGITLVGHNNIITGNTANNNDDDGIGITEGTNNTMSGNTANYNNDYGLGLHRGGNNTITENTANGNYQGIFLTQSNSNTISNNTGHNNVIGIYLHESYSNTVANNTFWGNRGHDVDGEYITEESEIEESGTEESDSGVLLFIGFVGLGEFILITLLAGLIAGKRLSKREYASS